MQILHVVATDRRRGAEMFAADLIGALNRAGVSQRVAVLRGSKETLPWDAPSAVLASNGWRAPGLRVNPRTLLALRAQIAERRPSVVQAHGGEPLKYVVLASAGLGAPVVYRRIGSAHPWITGRLHRSIHGALMRRAARVVAVAEAVRWETVDRFHVPAPRVVIIPNGVDIRRMETSAGREATRARLRIPSTAPVLISVGALSWDKDPMAHLMVASTVLRERPDAVHLFVGEGPLRHEVEAHILLHGLEGRVRLLGSREDVADLVAASDVLLLASRTEGMPACLIEAGMVGVPSVAYGLAGVPEVVRDGETGLLAPPGDPQHLASCVLRLLADEGARRAMGEAARERCRSLFEITPVAERYLGLYQGVLNGS